ncbi:coiled-coil domain-containing protein 47-like isoform X2 [Actinia tenebrosa]|uniref:PAT complex subunit CCDC47 n=1 Tax=Actinia tenebrosa TaxID=6105 RepID=A0A6P8INP2_ACTTE|nr:coiled-coil domain-containing protein 47-like isoform X1 [Actinia tenebrosa]XP_031568495.1 coiled-coil domain-containing protein 47-like isoform X2 [Actinia tenebrosa]
MASVRGYVKLLRPWFLMLLMLLVLLITYVTATEDNVEAGSDSSNDFAEFEQEVDDDDEEAPAEVETPPTPTTPPNREQVQEEDKDDDDATVEPDEPEGEEEFDHFTDEEEFEGYNKDKGAKGKPGPQPDLKIEKVPLHLRANWEGFYAEILTLAGLVAYALNFFAGRNKNSKLATAWFKSNKELLENNFHIVGDDGSADEPQQGILVKESESLYTLWCTGRVGCNGLLVELKLQKRHDLVNVMSHLVKPVRDTITITVHMTDEEMDNFVLAVVPKKMATKMQKELLDLNFFCPDKRSGNKYDLPSSLVILTESTEAANILLSQQVSKMINTYEDMFESMIFSDQYVGPKQEDDDQGNAKPVKPKKVLIFNFKVGNSKGNTKAQDMVKLEPMTRLVLFCIDRVRRFKLGKDAKARAEKNRRDLEESILKQNHAQRQEAAQLRREEKARESKEKMMQEEDPDRQRRLEERENKKEAKRRNPFKIKQIKARG